MNGKNTPRIPKKCTKSLDFYREISFLSKFYAQFNITFLWKQNLAKRTITAIVWCNLVLQKIVNNQSKKISKKFANLAIKVHFC